MHNTNKQPTKPAGKSSLRKFIWLFAIFAVLPIGLQFTGFSINLGTEMMIIALFAMGYNILLGTTGLASFGHAAFFGTGAYAVGILQNYGINSIVPSLAAAIAAGAIAATIIGLLVNKKRGIYLGLLTLAFGQMFYIIALRWDEVTGGETGLTGIERPTFFAADLNHPIVFYYFVFVIFFIAIITIWKITKSPFGSMLSAIKGNEVRTQYLGYRTSYYKLVAFCISGAFAGLAGGLFAWHQFAVYPQTMFWVESGNVVILTLLGGGLSSFFGPIFGAVIFVGVQDAISSYTEHWMFFFGMMFILVVITCPNGIPELIEKIKKFFSGNRTSSGKTLADVKEGN